MFFSKYIVSKCNKSLWCFFMFFRANISQVKLDKVSLLFNMTSLVIRRSNSFSPISKILKETNSKYTKHWKQPPRGFLQNSFYDTLTLKQMLQKYRSSRLEVFCRKGILRNFEKFTGKHCARVSFVIKLQA